MIILCYEHSMVIIVIMYLLTFKCKWPMTEEHCSETSSKLLLTLPCISMQQSSFNQNYLQWFNLQKSFVIKLWFCESGIIKFIWHNINTFIQDIFIGFICKMLHKNFGAICSWLCESTMLSWVKTFRTDTKIQVDVVF